MLSRIFTRLFYAVIFFGAGVWAAPHLGGASRLLDDGLTGARQSAVALWDWAEETFSPTGFKPSATPTVPAKSASAPAPAPAQASAPAAPAPAPAVATAPAAAPTATAARPVAQPAPTPAPAAAPAKADALAAARAAFARGDVAGAVRAYEDRLVDQPGDATAAGELGNVLWANGRRSEAAASYHRAALALIGQGRKAEASALVSPIRAGDPSLADDLTRRLATTAATP